MIMRQVVAEIKRRGKMSGYEVVNFCQTALGRGSQSAGACLARALEHGYIKIVGITRIGGIDYNLYS